MTDRLLPLSTIVAPSQTAVPALAASGSTPETLLKKQETVDEEPYTIKCICGFSDDDGNTIYCETCDTWQHIECYYPDSVEDALREDFAHSCADCNPRPLDSRTAHDRQQARINSLASEENMPDKKPRRPPAKSHRKKPKPSELQISGHSSSKDENTNKHGASHDLTHTHRKSKSTHKASQSVSSHAPRRDPSHGASKANPAAQSPSPATTPPEGAIKFRSQNYAQNTTDDRSVKVVTANSFARLEIPLTLSMWLRDPTKMENETGCLASDVFQKTPSNLETLKATNQVAHRSSGSDFHFLSAVVGIDKDVPLLELNGQIGFQTDYCREPSHRWNELTAPVSFVFFHPMLPLYIDTRREGSTARYVRRSCKPNSALDTYLTDSSEYHFWLVSERRISPMEQITIPWDVRFPADKRHRMLHILGLGDDEVGTQEEPELDDMEYEGLANWVDLILSEYGGCACDQGSDCAFVRFKQNFAAKIHHRSNSQPSNPSPAILKKRLRKPRTHHTVSPTSTGHATNSRAASEGHLEGSPEHDGMSQSGSGRSKPPSRDMTPARQGSFDQLGILTAPTDRDKRKVAMVEDSFRRMEQQQPPRKKKRISDGTGSCKTKSTSKSVGSPPSNMPPGDSERRYVDAGAGAGAGTSRSKSHSPPPPGVSHQPSGVAGTTSPRHASVPMPFRSGSVTSRCNFVDAAVQTDAKTSEVPSGSPLTSKPKRRVRSLSSRLLTGRQKRSDEEERRKQMMMMTGSTTPMDLDSPTSQQGPSGSSSVEKLHGLSVPGLRVDMSALKNKPMDLRVQLPPAPGFGTSSLAPTALSATSPMMQSPFTGASLANNHFGLFSGATTSTPIKKKMSLSDYKSRHSKAQAARPSAGTTLLKTSVFTVDEPKSASSVDTPMTGVSPATEKAAEMKVPADGTSA